MCYPDDARPPDHGRGGAVGASEELVLTAADGNKFAAYASRAAAPSGAGIVILPDVRGLHNFYRALACRFAEAGIDAVAIDYFGRTAGIGVRDDDFEYKPHVERTTAEGIAADTAAAIAHLRSEEGGAVGPSSPSGSALAAPTPGVSRQRRPTSPGRSASMAGRSGSAR